MKVLGFIPARGNSKRLKFKNLINVKNKKLIDYTINVSKKSKKIDKLVLSSENKKIISHGRKKGIKYIDHRAKKLSKDNVSSSDVLYNYLKKTPETFDYVLLLQPTSPARKIKDIDKSLEKIKRCKYDSLISIYKSNTEEKNPIMIKKNKFLKKFRRKKNVKSTYYVNGAIYISKYCAFLKNRSFLSKKTGYFLMPKNRSIDIDYFEDLKKFYKINFK